MSVIVHDTRLALLAGVIFSLSAWRLARFVIFPWLYPTDPKEYPYWIPFIGHLNSFFTNSSKLLSDASLYFHNTEEPFALTVAGQKWYIVTKPEDVTSTYKIDSGSLSYDIFAVEVMGMVGISEEGIRKAFQTQHVAADGRTTVRYKHLVRLCKEFQLEQLTPGVRLDQLVGPAIDLLGRHMNIESIHRRGAGWYSTGCSPASAAQGSVQISLYQWVSDIFIDMGTKAYFGDLLENIDPGITRTFMIFESLSWQAMYQYPRFLCGEMMRAKQRLQNAMGEYFASSKENRADTSWFISKIEEEMGRLNISGDDRAIFFFQLYWSINGNTRKAPFWILSYLMFNEDLVQTLREETAPAFNGETVDVAYLVDVETCPRLNSVWEETIRMTAFAASVRFLACDLEIGGKTLRRGNRLMLPQRQLHFSTQAFGRDASRFDPERFLKDPALRRHPSLRPFGGGASMCPGRNMAKRTTLGFVAMALRAFDIVPDPSTQAFPKPSEGKPSIGLVDIEVGSDLQVAILGKDITEELILETHGFLTHKVDCLDSDLKGQQYSGVYRSTPVVAGFSAFPPPAHVPRLMRAMVAELNADIAKAVTDGSLDPVMLSAKYCHKFVNIHPFADGNGRTCRLLLNAILLKHGGLIVCLGEDADDRAKYLEIASTGSMNEMSDLDNHDDNTPAKHWKELATFCLSHATKGAHDLVKILKKEH